MFKEKINQTNAMPEELTEELTEEQLENVNGGFLAAPLLAAITIYEAYRLIKRRRR